MVAAPADEHHAPRNARLARSEKIVAPLPVDWSTRSKRSSLSAQLARWGGSMLKSCPSLPPSASGGAPWMSLVLVLVARGPSLGAGGVLAASAVAGFLQGDRGDHQSRDWVKK